VLEIASEKLQRQVNGENAWAGINALMAGHHALQNIVSLFNLDIWIGSRQHMNMNNVFLQSRWADTMHAVSEKRKGLMKHTPLALATLSVLLTTGSRCG